METSKINVLYLSYWQDHTTTPRRVPRIGGRFVKNVNKKGPIETSIRPKDATVTTHRDDTQSETLSDLSRSEFKQSQKNY